MSFELTFAITTGLIAFIAALVRSARDIEQAQLRSAKLHAVRLAQVERIRKSGRELLTLRRNMRKHEQRLKALEKEIGAVEGTLQSLSGIDRRVYVLDDRRTPSDLTWIAVVSNAEYATLVNARARPDATRDWASGRRFMVWALDEAKATEKVGIRYPERDGFRLESIQADRGGPHAVEPK